MKGDDDAYAVNVRRCVTVEIGGPQHVRGRNTQQMHLFIYLFITMQL